MNIDVRKVKIIVTVPSSNTEEVRKAICDAGAGVIGNYKYCTVCTKCIGTFIPTDEAKPYIGKINNLEFAEEDKLEAICDITIVKKVLKMLREAHPYEEPGIDIIPLIDESDL